MQELLEELHTDVSKSDQVIQIWTEFEEIHLLYKDSEDNKVYHTIFGIWRVGGHLERFQQSRKAVTLWAK